MLKHFLKILISIASLLNCTSYKHAGNGFIHTRSKIFINNDMKTIKTSYSTNNLSQIQFGKIFLALSSTLLFPALSIGSASEAIQLLHGYQPQTPVELSWIVLLSGLFIAQFEIAKLISKI